jgi:hypothetical protein
MDVDTHDAWALSVLLAEVSVALPQRAARAHRCAVEAALQAAETRAGRMRADREDPPPSDEDEAESDEDEDEPESEEDAGATTAEDARVDNVDGAAPRMSAAAADQVREELEDITAGIESRAAFMPCTPSNQPHHGSMATGLTAPGVCLHGDDADDAPSDDQLVSWARSFHHNATTTSDVQHVL